MTLTINLPPEAEQRLKDRAAQQGQRAEEVAAAVLADVLSWDEEPSEEAVRGIQRGLDDFAAGRFRPLGEFAAEQRRKYDLSDTE